MRDYSAQVSPPKVSLPMVALALMHCDSGTGLEKTSSARQFPEKLALHNLTGSHKNISRK